MAPAYSLNPVFLSPIRERTLADNAPAARALDAIWKRDEKGRRVLLEITPGGLAAIGVDAPAAPTAGPHAAEAGEAAADAHSAATAATESHSRASRKSRVGSKQALLIAMLRRKAGATIAQAVEATGWQPHTVRGALAGALKKRVGLAVASESIDGVRVYRIAD